MRMLSNATALPPHLSDSAYSSKMIIGGGLAGLTVRAVTIAAISGVSERDARALVTKTIGEPSRSGRTPVSQKWFLSKRNLRLQSAYLLLSYAKYREHFDGALSPFSLGLAFTLTYDNYRRMYGANAEISAERLALLVKDGFGTRWRKIASGATSDFEHDNVKVLKCRKCMLPHLVEAEKINYVCEECQEGAKPARKSRRGS